MYSTDGKGCDDYRDETYTIPTHYTLHHTAVYLLVGPGQVGEVRSLGEVTWHGQVICEALGLASEVNSVTPKQGRAPRDVGKGERGGWGSQNISRLHLESFKHHCLH